MLLFKNNISRIFIAVCISLLSSNIANAQIGFLAKKHPSLSSDIKLSNSFFSDTKANSKPFSLKRKRKQYELSETEIEYNPKRDPKRLLYNTGLYAGAAVISFTTLWLMPESVTNWDKEEMKQEGIGNKWIENVKAGPVWDEDDWVLNYVMHPWFGGVYYMSARGSGFKAWESFAYSAFMSTVFWEYGIEAFAEVPSTQDLIVTPVLGSLVGEGFFMAKKSIRKNGNRLLGSRTLGRFTAFLIDPFNAIINGLGYQTKNKITATSSIVPVGFNQTTNKPVWGMQVSVNF